METLIRKSRSDNLIDTIDSVRFTFIATLLMMGKKSVLITGKYNNTNKYELMVA